MIYETPNTPQPDIRSTKKKASHNFPVTSNESVPPVRCGFFFAFHLRPGYPRPAAAGVACFQELINLQVQNDAALVFSSHQHVTEL